MATYYHYEVRFRGRLVNVCFRYTLYHGAYVVRGKAMRFSLSDRNRLVKKLLAIVERQRRHDEAEWDRTHPDTQGEYW